MNAKHFSFKHVVFFVLTKVHCYATVKFIKHWSTWLRAMVKCWLFHICGIILQNVNTCPVDRQVYNLVLARHPGEQKVFKKVSIVPITNTYL